LIFSHPLPHLIREFGYSSMTLPEGLSEPSKELIMRCCPPSPSVASASVTLPLDDDLTKTNNNTTETETTDDLIQFVPNSFFSCGNLTVLNWGQIISNGHFHSHHEIYPLGFKCLRQEYDRGMNCLVDLLCEIDSTSSSSSVTEENKQDLRPLFRVTVGWKTESSMMIVPKVYEGKSPQVVWQSILAEPIGPSPPPPPDESAVPASPDEEGIDEEERNLRNQLMELRQRYQITSLHSEEVPSPSLISLSPSLSHRLSSVNLVSI
jgi:hypothetical protein